MQYTYNVTVVGIGPLKHIPQVCPGDCMGLDCARPGTEVEFLMWCLQSINATMTINPMVVNTDDMLKTVMNGSADITLRTVNWKPEQQEQVDFTIPVSALYLGYFVKENTQVEVGDYIGNALPGLAALLVVIAGFSVSCLLHLFTKILTRSPSSLFSFANFVLAGFFRNSNLSPEPISSRILVWIWLLFSFLMTEYYGAKIRSILLLTHYRGVLFDNLDGAMDAMEYRGWKMVIENGSSYSPFSYCQGVQCTRLRELQRKSFVLLYNYHEAPEEAAEMDQCFGFGEILGYRAPHEMTLLDNIKRILFVRDRLISPSYRSYAVRKKMPGFLKKLNRAIAFAIEGFSTLCSRYLKPPDQYVNKHFQTNANILTLGHLSVLFKWAGLLLLLSASTFLAEVLYYRYSTPLLDWIRKSGSGLSFTGSRKPDNIELTHFSVFTK